MTTLDGICELTLETPDRAHAELEAFYFEDPEGNVVEAWDFFNRGEGSRTGVAALE